MRKKSLTKEQREIQIINWFQIRIQHDNEDTASMAEIAQGIGISPSSHLRSILDNLVQKQSLSKHVLKRPGRWKGWGYRLKKGTYEKPDKKGIVLNFTQKGIWYTEEL